jgi:ribosomal protein S27AE
MKTLTVECLRCGDVRQIQARHGEHVQAGECKRCDYVGWASVSDLTEKLRRMLRERPPERRRLYAAS